MQDALGSENALGARFGLSKEAANIAVEVFAASTQKLGIDGREIFRSFAETGSFKAALGVSDQAIEGLYGRAHQQFSIGQYRRAEEIFRTLCALDRDRADFWLGLGICYRLRGEDTAAMAAFDKAAAVSPSSAIPHFHRLDTLIRSENWAEAEKACDLFEAKRDGSEPDDVNQSFAKYKTALDMRRSA